MSYSQLNLQQDKCKLWQPSESPHTYSKAMSLKKGSKDKDTNVNFARMSHIISFEKFMKILGGERLKRGFLKPGSSKCTDFKNSSFASPTRCYFLLSTLPICKMDEDSLGQGTDVCKANDTLAQGALKYNHYCYKLCCM